MIQLWYQARLGYIKSYFIRTGRSSEGKVLNATAADTLHVKELLFEDPRNLFQLHQNHISAPNWIISTTGQSPVTQGEQGGAYAEMQSSMCTQYKFSEENKDQSRKTKIYNGLWDPAFFC